MHSEKRRKKEAKTTSECEREKSDAEKLTRDFSLGQVLRVPLLSSGHRPGIYTGIARRATQERSALLLLLPLLLLRLLLLHAAKLAPKFTGHPQLTASHRPQVRPADWPLRGGSVLLLHSAVTGRGAALGAGALARSSVPKWLRASLLGARREGGTAGLVPPSLSHHPLKGPRRGKKSGAVRRRGHFLMVCPSLCPLSGHWTLSGPVWRSDAGGWTSVDACKSGIQISSRQVVGTSSAALSAGLSDFNSCSQSPALVRGRSVTLFFSLCSRRSLASPRRARVALRGSVRLSGFYGGRKLKFKCGRDVQSAVRRESGD